MKRKKDFSKNKNQFPVVADILGVWEEAPVQDDIASDVLGSYTGNAEDGEYPQQDADDL